MNLEGSTVTLLLKDNKIYLTTDHSIDLGKTALGAAGSIPRPVYIIVKVNKVSTHSRYTYSAAVLRYQFETAELCNNQQQLFHELNKIQNIDFEGLVADESWKLHMGEIPRILNSNIKDRETVKEESFQISFKKIVFNDEFVSFSHKFKNIKTESVTLKITNPFIKKEFNAISDYFPKALNSSKIQVSAKVVIKDDYILSSSAISPQIAKINDEILSNVKQSFICKSLNKSVKSSDEFKVYTIDDLLSKNSEGQITQLSLKLTDEEFLNAALKIESTRHYNHLKYLSGVHDAEKFKLRIVTSPYSFIFLFSGKSKSHIIWETLNTKEATYVWSGEKNIEAIKQGFQEVESIINEISVNGKTQYIQNSNESFQRIYHDYGGENDGFLKWKKDLQIVLV